LNFILISLERKLILTYLFLANVAKHIRFCSWVIVLHNPCQFGELWDSLISSFRLHWVLKLEIVLWSSMAIIVSEKGAIKAFNKRNFEWVVGNFYNTRIGSKTRINADWLCMCVNASMFSLITIIGPSRFGSHAGWMFPG